MMLDEYKKLELQSNLDLFIFLKKAETNSKFSSEGEKSLFLNELLNDLEKRDWDEKTTTQALVVIKTLGRDPTGSDPIFTREAILLLTKLAGLYKPKQVIDTSTTQEALKCISNCIHLNSDIKPYLEESDVVGSCQYVLQSENLLSLETQFLTCRILFFLSVHRADIATRLIELGVSNSIEKVLSNNLSKWELESTIDQTAPINPFTVISEALKLLFNLMMLEKVHDQPPDIQTEEGDQGQTACADDFKNCLGPIFFLVFKVPYAEPQPLVPPYSQAIHALMQFPYPIIAEAWSSQSRWTKNLFNTSEEGHELICSTLVNVLERAVGSFIPDGNPDDTDRREQADAALAPLLLVLRSLARGNVALRKRFAKLLLPNDSDRLQPVHQGQTLSAYMIRLMTSTMMPQTRNAACETLYVLCDEDASKFTQEVGYGNSVGFLLNKGISMEPPKGENDGERPDINPITGQYVSQETGPDLKDMTDEEKEREAERLFVLFERLKKTGVINVENPIAKAMQEGYGRFEEVHSDSESD